MSLLRKVEWTPEKIAARSTEDIKLVRERAIRANEVEIVEFCDLELARRRPQRARLAARASTNATVRYSSEKENIRNELRKIAGLGQVTYYGDLGAVIGRPARWPLWNQFLTKLVWRRRERETQTFHISCSTRVLDTLARSVSREPKAPPRNNAIWRNKS